MKNVEGRNIIIFASNIFFHSRFNRNLIDTLLLSDNSVSLAYDFNFNKSYVDEDFISFCINNEIPINNISVPRNILKIHNLLVSFIQTLILFYKTKPDVVHTHTPIISAIVRICSVFFKHEVIYTAHGLHFYYKNNYLVGRHYYYVERFLSKITDKICLINVDDYLICKKSFYCNVYYIPGIGIETFDYNKSFMMNDNSAVRFISVGELNKNKNHLFVINALSEMNLNFNYTILGEGIEIAKLNKVINNLSLQSKVRLIGYVQDVAPYLENADVFIHPSKREGLPVALMEAMSYQLPVLVSDIRGCRDLLEEYKGGFFFDPLDTNSFKMAVNKVLSSRDKWFKMGLFNQMKLMKFSTTVVKANYLSVYELKEK